MHTGDIFEFLKNHDGVILFDLPFERLTPQEITATMRRAAANRELCIKVKEEDGFFLWVYPKDHRRELDESGIEYKIIEIPEKEKVGS